MATIQQKVRVVRNARYEAETIVEVDTDEMMDPEDPMELAALAEEKADDDVLGLEYTFLGSEHELEVLGNPE
ncbi:hypothetical protein [Thioalkalivibrio sp. ALE19]|uniref:hypothetical protein n=1 Tax=Thioalkalivibrio sp. ALE19 TaxID=1266909 RepID=UPI0004044CD8|nr:hypothetical protein [Thioalkalivibrio sp. ALE19]